MSPQSTSQHRTCTNCLDWKSHRQHLRKFSASSSRLRLMSSYKSFKAVHNRTPAKGRTVLDHWMGEKSKQTRTDMHKK